MSKHTFPIKANNLTIMLLDIYLKDLKIHIHTNIGMQMFAVLSGQNSEVTKMPFNKEVNFDTHNGQKKVVMLWFHTKQIKTWNAKEKAVCPLSSELHGPAESLWCIGCIFNP